MIIIESGTLDDLAAVLELERASFAWSEQWSEVSWRAELSSSQRRVLIARAGTAAAEGGIIGGGEFIGDNRDNRVLGALSVQTIDATADLHRIAVAGDQRRSGVGRRLVEAGIEAAREDGASQMILEVRYDNEPAIALYQAAGFEQLAVRRNYYGPGADALVLKLYRLGGDRTELRS